MSREYRDFENLLDELLEDPNYAADYLSEALRLDDVETFLMSLKEVVRVHGDISAIAQKADLSRSTLYNMLGATTNPGIKTILSVLHAVGYDITITRRQPKRRQLRAR